MEKDKHMQGAGAGGGASRGKRLAGRQVTGEPAAGGGERPRSEAEMPLGRGGVGGVSLRLQRGVRRVWKPGS